MFRATDGKSYCLVINVNQPLTAHPYSVRPYRDSQENSYKSSWWFGLVKISIGNILLHLSVYAQAFNVPTLRLLGFIWIFSFQTNDSEIPCRHAGEGNTPAFNSGFLIYVGWRETWSCSGRVLLFRLFLTGTDRFCQFIEQGQPCLTLPFSPKYPKRALI